MGDGGRPASASARATPGTCAGSASTSRCPSPGRCGPGGRRLPLAHTLGAWLLDEAGYAGTRVGVGPATLRRVLRELPGPVGVLADGGRVGAAHGQGARATSTRPPAVRRRCRRGAGRRGRRRARRARPGGGGAAARGRGARLARGRGGARRPRRSPPGCTTTTRPSASATSSPTGSRREPARRPWWPSSARPPPARRRSPSRSRSGWAGRWSTPTRCSSTAAWTSAPPSPTSPSAAACRTTCSTCGTCGEAASVAEYRRRARAEIDRLRAAGVVPLLVGGSGLYVRAVLDELDFPGTDPAVRARLEDELAAVGAGGAARAAGRRSTRPRRRRSCRATDGGSCARWRSSS